MAGKSRVYEFYLSDAVIGAVDPGDSCPRTALSVSARQKSGPARQRESHEGRQDPGFGHRRGADTPHRGTLYRETLLLGHSGPASFHVLGPSGDNPGYSQSDHCKEAQVSQGREVC